MAYDERKLTRMKSLKQLAQRINERFATKDSKGDALGYTQEGELGLYSGEKLLSSVPIEGGGGVPPNIQATAKTLPAGSEATVTRTGSNGNPVFHFGIPAGEPGKDGAPGLPGVPGADGAPGAPGDTPYIGENGNWWVGNTDTGVTASGGGGEKGDPGTTFTPSVSEEGVISWTNDGGLENPEPVNIKGPPGTDGKDGAAGAQGPAGPGLPPGGTTGQIPAKASDKDYDVEWTDPPEGGGGVTEEELAQALSGKQDAITGTVEQVVGFDATGGAVPVPNPVRGYTKAEYDALPEDQKGGLVVLTDKEPSGGNSGKPEGLVFLKQQYCNIDRSSVSSTINRGITFWVYKDGEHGIAIFYNAVNKFKALPEENIRLYLPVDLSDYINPVPGSEPLMQLDAVSCGVDTYQYVASYLDLTTAQFYIASIGEPQQYLLTLPGFARFENNQITFKEATS